MKLLTSHLDLLSDILPAKLFMNQKIRRLNYGKIKQGAMLVCTF